MQLGVLNIAKQMRGVQIGLVNHTADLKGLQIGLLNHSDKGGLPFTMLFNASI
jgi:hypothetical protein